MSRFQLDFPAIKRRYEERPNVLRDLICKQGSYNGCRVLKLQKQAWTNDRIEQLQNESGIFFSVWIDEKSEQTGRANYNIHALKLRRLRGYSITSREFAAQFRARFDDVSQSWPNASISYGPSTLMQGWIRLDPKTFQEDALQLLRQFQELSPVIDALLAARRRV